MNILEDGWLTKISFLLATTNKFLDTTASWVLIISILVLNSYILFKWFQNENKRQKTPTILGLISSLSRSFYLFGIFITVQVMMAVLFFYIPHLAPQKFTKVIQWFEIYIAAYIFIYFSTKRYSGNRGVHTALYHITVLLIGWVYGKWLGMFFISGTIFLISYYWLYRLALVVVPTANPEDKKEAFLRFKVLAWYVWGLQFPIWVVKEATDRKAEERIPGDIFRSFSAPGIIWAQSNQAVGITKGTQFSRVEGPGVIFTKPYERPYEVVDLRVQIRTTLIEAVSQDGIQYKARLLAVFSIDKEPWENPEYATLRSKNHLLRGANRTDRIAGNYKYSRRRVTATLSIESVKQTIAKKERSIVYWDEWVVTLIEEAARKELSRHSLNELWIPFGDTSDTNPLDGIAVNIKEKVTDQIRSNGIKLVAARIINFEFDGEEAEKIRNQQIDNWMSWMEKSITKTNSDADAKSEKLKKAAGAYARSNLLTAVAKGLDQINENHKNLPKKYVVAIRLIAALEDALRRPTGQQSTTDENKDENNKKIAAFGSSLNNFTNPTEES